MRPPNYMKNIIKIVGAISLILFLLTFFSIFNATILEQAKVDHDFITYYSGDWWMFWLQLIIDISLLIVIFIYYLQRGGSAKKLFGRATITSLKYFIEIFKIGIVLYLSLIFFHYQYAPNMFPMLVLGLTGLMGYFLTEKFGNWLLIKLKGLLE